MVGASLSGLAFLLIVAMAVRKRYFGTTRIVYVRLPTAEPPSPHRDSDDD